MNYLYTIFLIFPLILSGCTSNPDPFLNDNPQVRQRQKSQTTKLLVDDSQRIELEEFLGKRVEGIWVKRNENEGLSGTNLTLIGRAASVSGDGYFLTAYHVVDDSPVYLFNLIKTEKFNRSLKESAEKGEPFYIQAEQRKDYFREEFLRGRVLWSDPKADLAVLKFEHTSNFFFEEILSHFQVGQILISADDFGMTSLPSGETFEMREGNGRYFASGKIVKIESIGNGTSHVITDMIARKGMSGAAVTDLNGNLCAILSSIGGHNSKERFCWSSNLSQEQLTLLIESDRRINSN